MIHPATRDLPYIIWVSVLLFLALAVISYFYWKQATEPVIMAGYRPAGDPDSI